jgi:hypothetical protein
MAHQFELHKNEAKEEFLRYFSSFIVSSVVIL